MNSTSNCGCDSNRKLRFRNDSKGQGLMLWWRPLLQQLYRFLNLATNFMMKTCSRTYNSIASTAETQSPHQARLAAPDVSQLDHILSKIRLPSHSPGIGRVRFLQFMNFCMACNFQPEMYNSVVCAPWTCILTSARRQTVPKAFSYTALKDMGIAMCAEAPS